MWMLLEPNARKPVAAQVTAALGGGVPEARAHPAKQHVASTRPSLLEYLSAAAAAPSIDGAGVSVFLHPGRTPVGAVAVERMFDQFECAAPEVHATLEEAEARHEGEVGFLLDVNRPFADPRGQRHPRGVLFARSVRD